MYFRRAANGILWGAVFGAATWFAYGEAEVLFDSVLFRLTRPFAVFQPWHWRLTGLLLVAYVMVGTVAGAFTGMAVSLARKAGWMLEDSPEALDTAAALTVPVAFLWNVLAHALNLTGGIPVLIAAACCSVLLLVALKTGKWSALGLLTNPWVLSILLLGVEQTADMLDMASGQQLGGKMSLAVKLMVGALIVLVAGAVWPGRKLRNKLAPRRWAVLTLVLAAAVIVSTELIGKQQASHRVIAAQPVTDSSSWPLPANGKPNLLVIVMDTVRADHLSLYGYGRDTTPNLRDLAQDAVVYTHAQSAGDMTLTSHASLFTGMYPSWHGAYCKPPAASYGSPLSKSVPTLAEMLKRQGYVTFGIGANLYLRSAFGLDRGFQEFRIRRPVPLLNDENRCQLRRQILRLLSLVVDTAQFDRLYSNAEEINDEFLTTLDQRRRQNDNPQAPFFGFINYMDAHFPYTPPAPWDRRFPGKVSTLTKDYLESEAYQISNGGDGPGDYQKYCVSQYDGGIGYLDSQIGRIVAALKQRGLYDSTMIVVTSDHGEAFGERHRVQHGNSPYQNLLHVALLIKYPKAVPKGRTEAPVSLVDVAPTVLNLAGIPVPQMMQGHSLLDGPARRPTELFSETFACAVLQPAECYGCTARAMVAWPFKYIVFNTGKKELFMLDADPDETSEVSEAGEMAAITQTMEVWRKTIPMQSLPQMKLSSEEERRLKSLGYLGGGADSRKP